MAEKLVVISDMWGAKNGVWATSYLVYLQQYFDLTYYDSQRLAKIELSVDAGEQINEVFGKDRIDVAITQLIHKEKEPCHYVAFGIGGTIAWKASRLGLPMKSLYAVSVPFLGHENDYPEFSTKMVYGDLDANLPSNTWFDQMEVDSEIIKGFGHDLYTHERIIKKISQDLLSLVTNKIKSKSKVIQFKKPLLVS